MIKFTEYEIKALQESPEALQALADWHEWQLTMADAIGDFDKCVEFHSKRKKEILEERDRLIKLYEEG